MLSIFVGIAFLVIGAFGVILWPNDFIVVVRGFGALSLLLGGILAIVFGISSIAPAPPNAPKEK